MTKGRLRMHALLRRRCKRHRPVVLLVTRARLLASLGDEADLGEMARAVAIRRFGCAPG